MNRDTLTVVCDWSTLDPKRNTFFRVYRRHEIRAKTIRPMSEQNTFRLPENQQSVEDHAELIELAIVENATKCMTKLGQYRNLRITSPSTVVPLHFEAELDCVFDGTYLLEEHVPR